MCPPSILMTESRDGERIKLRKQKTPSDSIKDSTKRNSVMRTAKLFAAIGKTSESRSRTRIAKLLTYFFLHRTMAHQSTLHPTDTTTLQQFWINVLLAFE